MGYFTTVLLGEFIFLMYVLRTTKGYDFNDLFLTTVLTAAFILRKVDDVLMLLLYLILLFVLWKFKDRVLAALGVQNSHQIFGDYRDWLTCWGMTRFEPIEIYLWK